MSDRKINALIKLIIVILVGYLGIHKFIEKNTKMGWIYLFTCGLFGVGWIIDIIIALKDFNELDKESSNLNKIPIVEETSKNKESLFYDVDSVDELINYKKDRYNKEQVTALFLKSMSYRPHKIGKNNEDDYPRYLTYDYNILDVPAFHKELLDKGYFCEASFKNIISYYKVNELKDLLISKEQKVTGLKKDDLINLAIDVFSKKEKEEIEKESNLYELSNDGLEYLEKNKEFLTIVDFQKYGITYSLFMKYKNKLPQYCTLRDVVWGIFNERLNYYSINKSYSSLRSVYLNMAQFLEEEKPNIDVLYNYILCLYYDINLTYNQEQILGDYLDKETLIECLDDRALANGIVTKIKEYSKYHDDKIYDKLFKYEKLPFKFISDDEFKEMVFDIYNSSFFDEEKYINIAVENAKKVINNIR